VSKYSYQDEIDYLVTNPARNKFIRNLTLSTTGNTLVLFTLVEKHGKKLYDMIAAKAGDRKVFLVYGDVSAERREEIRALVAKEKDAIIIASYATYQQGINVPSIENIVFASPTKSKIFGTSLLICALVWPETSMAKATFSNAVRFGSNFIS
jgi:superfamily II DNA or RNA helicase